MSHGSTEGLLYETYLINCDICRVIGRLGIFKGILNYYRKNGPKTSSKRTYIETPILPFLILTSFLKNGVRKFL